ncbi:MAG: hypothetical protein ABJA64_02525 [Candidatus Saccharibacteria bacterium]
MSEYDTPSDHELQPRAGHWLDESSFVSEKDLREPLPHGDKSRGDLISESYGVQGEGWDLIAEGDVSAENDLANELTGIESQAAVDDFKKAYMGEDVSYPAGVRPPQNQATHGKVGRIWIYPAGEEFDQRVNGVED